MYSCIINWVWFYKIYWRSFLVINVEDILDVNQAIVMGANSSYLSKCTGVEIHSCWSHIRKSLYLEWKTALTTAESILQRVGIPQLWSEFQYQLLEWIKLQRMWSLNVLKGRIPLPCIERVRILIRIKYNDYLCIGLVIEYYSMALFFLSRMRWIWHDYVRSEIEKNNRLHFCFITSWSY